MQAKDGLANLRDVALLGGMLVAEIVLVTALCNCRLCCCLQDLLRG